ncbi:MAG: alkaline phosphatase, partial [Victivallaceae bacterium]|nr:alkaline phosphatase [Victivallaceae bacterium]
KQSLLAIGNKPEIQKVLSVCNMKYEIDIDSAKDLTLRELTDVAIKFLDNSKGFFLMVEGGKIDWACHGNDSAAFIKETLAFDGAVKTAYDFYLKNPQDTLIVVTADHETGGLFQIKDTKNNFDLKSAGKKFLANIDKQKMSIEKFYYKYVLKWKRNKVPFEKALKEVEEELGLDDLTNNEKNNIRKAFDIYMAERHKSERPPELIKMYGSRNPIAIECAKIISARCGISWNSFNHSEVPVMTTAIGENCELFKGKYENTYIYNILKSAILSVK